MKKIIQLMLVIIAIPLAIAAFLENDIVYKKTIHINAPIDSVWQHTNSLAGLDSWSPWNRKDPNMTKEWTGIDGTIGASQSWDSDTEDVGKGSQTIAKIEAPTYFETDLKFIEPSEMESKGYVRLSEVENGTEVTWGFKSEMPYPFNLFLLFMNMEDHLGEDWSYGLNSLKELSEK